MEYFFVNHLISSKYFKAFPCHENQHYCFELPSSLQSTMHLTQQCCCLTVHSLIVFIADFFPWHRTSSVPICAPNFVLSIWTKIGFWTWKSLFPAGNQNSRFSSTISVNQSERDIFYIVVDKAIKKTMAVLETDEQNRNWSSFGGKLCFVAFSQWTVVVTCTTWHTVECKVIVPNGYRLERSF